MNSKTKKPRECRVCGIKIKVQLEHIGNNQSTLTGKNGRGYITSTEGVFFNHGGGLATGIWFCNDCWEKVRQ